MSKTLDLLLRPDCPNVEKERPTAKVELPRLSRGDDKAIFTLRALSYKQSRKLMEMPDDNKELQVILASCIDPDFKDPALLDTANGIATPEDVIKTKLLPGEIHRLTMAIDRLNGYRGDSIREIKNG